MLSSSEPKAHVLQASFLLEPHDLLIRNAASLRKGAWTCLHLRDTPMKTTHGSLMGTSLSPAPKVAAQQSQTGEKVTFPLHRVLWKLLCKPSPRPEPRWPSHMVPQTGAAENSRAGQANWGGKRSHGTDMGRASLAKGDEDQPGQVRGAQLHHKGTGYATMN